MSATTENSRLYGGSVRMHPEGIHVRRDGSRCWAVWDGVNLVKRFGRDRALADAFVAEYEREILLWQKFLYPKTARPVTRQDREIRTLASWGFA
jgi:hypothetical protein